MSDELYFSKAIIHYALPLYCPGPKESNHEQWKCLYTKSVHVTFPGEVPDSQKY